MQPSNHLSHGVQPSNRLTDLLTGRHGRRRVPAEDVPPRVPHALHLADVQARRAVQRTIPSSSLFYITREPGVECYKSLCALNKSAPRNRTVPSHPLQSYMSSDLNYIVSGNEVYYTACSLLAMLKDLCGQIHCQKDFHSISCSYKIHLSIHPHR